MTPKANLKQCGPDKPDDSALMSLYSQAVSMPSPINQDMPHLRHLASICGPGNQPGEVVEVVHQGLSAIALLAGRPKRLITYGAAGNRADSLSKILPSGVEYNAYPGLLQESPHCDMLFLDLDPHTSDYYYEILKRYAANVRRFIVMHDTIVYGTKFHDEPGMLMGIGAFLSESDRKWFIVAHHTTENGLMVLSRNESDMNQINTPQDLLEAAKTLAASPVKPATTIQVPAHGPGTELKAILSSLGINPSPSCDCNGKAAQMNVWGVDGCRQNRDTIIQWMRDGMQHWGWVDQLKAAAAAVRTGLAFQVNWFDPFPDIIDQAINRAAEKSQATVTAA
jgi:hypothetical protein